MLEVLNADYIRTARAKGVSERQVINKHAFRNTLIPLVTIVGGSLPGLFSGALITEQLYSIPGKVPNPVNMPNYCYFRDRCEMKMSCCDGDYPCEIRLSDTHVVSCYRYYEEHKEEAERTANANLLQTARMAAAGEEVKGDA